MKQFNLVPFLCNAIQDVANSLANTWKRTAEYLSAKAKLEMICKEYDLDVYESEQKANQQIRDSNNRKVIINSWIECNNASGEFDDASLKKMINERAILEELIETSNDMVLIEKYNRMLDEIDSSIDSIISKNITDFGNMVNDIVQTDQACNDSRKLLLE